MLIHESKQFVKNSLLCNQNQLQNLTIWLQSLDFHSFFDQQVALRKLLVHEISTLILQPMRDKINQVQAKYLKKLKSTASGEEQKESGNVKSEEKKNVFAGQLGQYMTTNGISRYVQKHMVNHKLLDKAAEKLYNSIMLEQEKMVEQVKQKDE